MTDASSNSNDDANITIEIDTLLNDVRQCVEKCRQFHKISGISKLERKFRAEDRFLQRLRADTSDVNVNHLKSSNLTHLRAVIEQIEEIGPEKINGVLVPFKDNRHQLLICELVYNEGRTWMKVIARNAQALHLIWKGNGHYGQRSILISMRQYLETARHNEIHYQTPDVVFYFVQGVTEPLANLLKKNGIIVKGSIVEVNEQVEKRLQIVDDFSSSDSDEESESEVEDENDNDDDYINNNTELISSHEPSKINLDVSTLICLVSELTHGGHVYRYPSKWLEVPAELERAERLAPKLEKYMEGKELFICQTAYEEFNSIVNVVGGPNEKKRAEELFKRLTIVPDCLSERSTVLQESVKIKPRTKIIFGTGDHLRAVTMTANRGFVRAAAQQGVPFAVYLHQSRALTEQQQHLCALPLLTQSEDKP
ncbi:unnamed protein product [Rotaria socialis]|uniref:DUF1308 domain-containing protein n=1 Tax=Rotaria socialis TaxID=392032 RepID=A0A818BDI5_9BILA|nr:unnamed protein product [Rotaria socialis]CAF3423119.1 unnamed protein product [Rotaria socialis]CAF3533131.1 unnamed protein product [Rotaria socialis]CAF3586415.1 unnamed protein product [Rotaria socialis]CAF3780589.1 unnamed protein product [Rotaria socialis]